jgi:PAS domain S-box-containing protein
VLSSIDVLLNALPRAVLITDGDGTILTWNASAEALYGRTPADLAGRSVLDVSLTSVGTEPGLWLLERARDGEAWMGEVTVARPDGTAATVQLYLGPLRDAEGDVVGLISSADDVTEARRLAQRATSLQDHLALALSAGRLGTWRWDAATGVTVWDAGMERLFGTAGFLLWDRVPRAIRSRLRPGMEVALILPLLVLGALVAYAMGPAVTAGLFQGDFQLWLKQTLDLVYDQRNCLVVGIAMGFAVIPIIFTIAEDAFTSVPQHLTAASLALGASRWQTAISVVLPTASPGIFSAVMIGFGRAVGETMIVLMATGNTPVLDWSIFDGMRTLSANIAVEVPEAPNGGTLYRTLFLAGLVLFMMTFLVNTVAEVVRQRLRERYRAI